MKQQLLLLLTFLFIQFQLSAQCGAGEQELFLTTSGGSFPNEKWVSITTGPDGGGTVIWAQGNGTYGNGSGLVTDESFCVTPGQTYYINCYDSYDDGWDGTTYAIRTGTGGSGTLIANNGGDSPNDGNNEDSTSSFEDPATELESSEAFSFTGATSVDCSGGGYTDDYCYENSSFEILEFQSSDGSALRITFNSGTVENTYDELIVYDSDGTTQLYNGYGSGGNVAGLSFTASGSTISFGVQADISVSCGSGSQTTINYTVSCVGCTPATVANAALSPNCPTDNSVTFDVTDMGSASSLTVTNDAGGVNPANITATGTAYTVTGLPADGSSVTITLTPDDDPACSVTIGPITLDNCPPANDDLCNAIALTLGASCTGDAYTNTSATTQTGEPSGSCFNGGAQNTVWFSFVAPASGEVTITTDIAPADLNDSEIALYGEGAGFDCTDLSTLSAQIACDQDGGSVVGFGYMSVIEATGLTGGETYYVQVSGYSNASGDFCIEVIEPCAIVSIVDAGTSTACNSSTNEYAQDVVVTYAAAPGSGTLDVTIDGITVNAPITGSPQTVTVSGLNADGASKDVSAAFSADGACSLNAVNVFVAPVACGCGITSITDAGTGVMDCVGATYDYEVVVAYENAPGSGTLDLSAGTGSASVAITGSPQTVLITGLTADGNAVNVSASFSADPGCSATANALFTAPVVCPPANDNLCDAIALTLGASCTGDAYTNVGATTQTGEPSGSCFSGGAQNTVWFSFVAPASGEVTITTDIAPADLNDSEIALYGEGAGFDCTDLSTLSAQIACDQDGGSVVGFGYMSVIEATGLTGGETYYVQVSGYSNASGDFCIEVIEPCAIVSIVDAGTSTACNSSTNEYAQDVVVTYAAAPGSGTLDVTIDGITVNAPITGSPQTVTVSGLNADGASKDVSAAFSADGACSLNAVNVFVAPVACGCGITSITDAGTGVMDCVGATYDYEVVVAYENAPGSGTLNLSAGTGSASVAITGSPQTVLITGLTADGNAVNVSASFSADPGCSATANALFTAPVACPPANDNLCDAIALTLGASCTGDAYTNVGATTQTGEPSGSCFSGGAQNTVWFSFVAPASGEVTITTDIAPADLNDSEIALYGEGAGFDCTDLSTLSAQIACDQDGGSVVGFGYMSVIEATGLTGGETYYVQVSGYSNASGDFCIEVIEPCAIVSIVDAGTSTACNSSTNEYAQDVVVTYAAAPGSGTLDVTIDGVTVNAPITGSPQTVTVSGLNADGASKDVSAAFSADGACSLNAVNVFVAPVACGCGITSITDAGTGVMDCVGATYDYEVVVAYENAPGSGTLELSAGTGSASVAITGSPQTVLITGLTADGNAVNVSASFSADPGCSATANALFTAPVACPPANDDCANAATLMVTEDGMCSNTAGTNLGATASGESPNPSCGSFGSGEDVWYEVTVPAIGELTIEMSSAGGPTDWTMQVYSGSCGSLSLVECDDDDGPGLFPSVTLSGRPEGEVLLVRVFEYGNNATGSFNICAFFTPECGTNSVVLETGMNIYELDEPCDAPNGWTYYSAPDVLGNYMFAIEWGDNNGAAKIAATVEITVDDMITAEDGSLAASYGMGRYWNVDIGGASLVDPVNVRFYYSPAEKAAVEAASAAFATLNGVPDNGFSWFKTDGTVFTPADITANNFDTEMVLLMEDATGTENGVTYVQFDGITSFSGGTGAAGAGAGFLPAELLSFSGESMSAGNKLAWTTATEENVADFIIERSVDARGSWERLGKVAAAGNSSDIVEYSFMDDKPLSSAYYRLRIEDVDGSFAYSPIIQLQRARGEAEVLLYPIPTKDRLMVRFENAQGESVQTRIYDLAGRQLQTAITAGQEGSQTLQLDVQALDAGVFILEMELDGQVYRQRFVKQ